LPARGFKLRIVMEADGVASIPSPKSLEFRPSQLAFFKARAKCPSLCYTGRASPAAAGRKTANRRGPEGRVENGSAASLLVSHVSIKISSFLTPRRRPILNATKLKGLGDNTLARSRLSRRVLGRQWSASRCRRSPQEGFSCILRSKKAAYPALGKKQP
jgi:hypothetical protein